MYFYKVASAERHIRFDNFEVYPNPTAGVLNEEVGFFGVVVGNYTCEVYGSSLFGLLYRQGANLARGSDESRGARREVSFAKVMAAGAASIPKVKQKK